MKTRTVLTLTLVLIAALAVTTANAQAEGTTYVYDTFLRDERGIADLAFIDNNTIIGGKGSGKPSTLCAWHVPSGNKRWSKDVGNNVNAVAVPSHNPHFIAYGGWNNNFDIRMRYSDDGDWRGSMSGHTNDIRSLAFKPNSYVLASGGLDNTIRLWDVGDINNLRHVRTLRGHTSVVQSVAWSPDGRTLASASYDGTVRLWNPDNGINFAVLRGHTESVQSVAWSPDGRILASGSNDGTVRLWNPDTHTTQRVLQGTVKTAKFRAVAFSPDGQTLLGAAPYRANGSGIADVYSWDLNTGVLKANVLKTHAVDLEFSPNGQILATTGNNSNNSYLYRLVTADVTGNGKINVNDLVEVAKNYGKTVGAGANRKADVNGDGEVNFDDLVLVAKAVDAAAAPALTQEDIKPGSLQAADVHRWIRDAKAANADPAGIAALEQLLAALTRAEAPPEKTVLLANYPNPFNPETWIPYQLSEAAEVTVTIHSSDGKLVRTLELGQMPAGAYSDKDRAAYWDGRNAQGEPVASGVYFYTLTAGDFSATRKMVIRK